MNNSSMNNQREKPHWEVDRNLAQRYSHPLDTQLYHDRPLMDLLGSVTGKRVLDIGAGNGYYSRMLAKSGATVVGIDASLEMIVEAQRQSKNIEGVTFQEAFAENLPFPNSTFDAAISTFTINTFSNREMVEGMLSEASRVLKSEGKIVISIPDPSTLNARTTFRWTEWQEGQTMDNLKPGDAIVRKIKQANGEMLTVTNYYWPLDLLIKIAQQHNLNLANKREDLATDEDLKRYPNELEEVQKTTPFFLVMEFDKK